MNHQFVTVNNGEIDINVAVLGEGPLIVCVHGWPELWYSWRHQMQHFADRGFQVAALDVRGYGGTSKPHEVEAYTLRELTGDVAAVIEALGGGDPAIVLGHDWGAPIAWNTARLHPEKVRAVAGLSVPYFPVSPDNTLDRWREMYTEKDKFFYQIYFQDEGVAEAEFEADSHRAIRMIYYAGSGDVEGEAFLREKPANAGMLEGLIDPDPFPAWASTEDLNVYGDAMHAGGWRGPLNRYRAQPLDAQDLGKLANPNLSQPAAFIGGERDMVRHFVAGIDSYDFAAMACDDFRGTTIIDGAGHWVQQEAPAAVNAALDQFIDSL